MMIRPYVGGGDDGAIARLRARVGAVEPDAALPTPADEGDPGAHCLVVEDAGRVVAYTWSRSWTELPRTRVYQVLGWVDPDHRGRGIGRRLLARQEEAAARWESTVDAPADAVVYAGAADSDEGPTARLLRASGYAHAFSAIQMRAPVSPGRSLGGGPESVLPEGIELRPLRTEHHPRIHDAIEAAFAAWPQGYVPRTRADYLAESRDADPRLWCVAWAGDEVAGVVVNLVQPDGTGLVDWVAVPPRYRRHGIARALMRETLRRFAAAGITRASLTAFPENATRSVDLYHELGFREVRRQYRYRKPMPRP